MSFNGSGSFLINSAGQPVVSGTVISSTAFNALTADLATGLSTCITKDGQTTVTANIPMATYKFTGLGAGSAATDSANLSQVQSTVVKLLASVSGADTITAVGSPVVTAYAAGQMFYFVAAGTNTGAVTLNIDGLGAKAVTRDGSTALIAGDIQSGEVCVVVYDGTRFQLINAANAFGNLSASTLTVSGNTYLATSSGNVGIGTSSPGTKLDVNGVGRFGDLAAKIQVGLNGDSISMNGDLYIQTSTANPLIFRTNTVERARITAAGGLAVGTTTDPGAGNIGLAAGKNLQYSSTAYITPEDNVSGARIVTPGIIRFDTGGTTERARITSSGDLLVGTTTQYESALATFAGVIAPRGVYTRKGTGTAGTAANSFNIDWTGSAANLWIDTSNAGTITLSSDYRIKKNVQTQTAQAIERVMRLRPVTYELNDYGDLFKADGVAREGFIAHEVQEVIPSGAEGQKDEENRIQNLRVDAILSVAVKAIQEQQAIIKALEAKVAALEAK
jgi:hypothetical protein